MIDIFGDREGREFQRRFVRGDMLKGEIVVLLSLNYFYVKYRFPALRGNTQ